MKRVTIKDIAKELGMSVSTVSRALSDDVRISKDTKQLVSTTAESMGYKRNIAAVQFRDGRSYTVGIISRAMLSPFSCRVTLSAQEELSKHNIRLMIANSDNDAEKEMEHIRKMENALVDGMIISPCFTSKNVEAFKKMAAGGRTPIVFFANALKDVNLPSISMDSYQEFRKLLESMISGGCRDIVFFNGDSSIKNFDELLMAYKEELFRHAIPYDSKKVVEVAPTVAAGQEAVARLLEQGIKPDGIVVYNETLAVGVMNYLLRRGIRVPEDIAVAGFCGSELAGMTYPTLTTIKPSVNEMGEKAAKMILEYIANRDKEVMHVTVGAKLCKGGSTR